MAKKIFILNGSGGVGKDTFTDMCQEFVSTYHYSSISLIKTIARNLGWEGKKEEKDRKFLSDLKCLATEYNDEPFRDLQRYVEYFRNTSCENAVLFIDIREPEEIKRASETFGAKTILIENPNVDSITTNMADANVSEYDYDYIIKNDGSLEQLRKIAKVFSKDVILSNNIYAENEAVVFICSKY